MKNAITLLILSLSLCLAQAQHQLWNDLLQAHVNEQGMVDYEGMQKDSVRLNEYLNSLSTFPLDRVRMSREGMMAFWINAYNAFTVKLIVDNYPLGSITELNDGDVNPWDRKFILMQGKYISLNHIEHEILRKQFQEARIHFIINCASISCPKLWNEAITADNLEGIMEEATTAYINNPQENFISPIKAEISMLFSWFADDFIQDAGSVKAFINRYSKVKLGEKAIIDYKTYNWALNRQP